LQVALGTNVPLYAQRLLNLNKDDLEKITGELKEEENVN
jgi:hypothetical protein